MQFDLQGKREFKYSFLNESLFNSIEWNKLQNFAPDYFYLQKNNDLRKIYNEGFSVNDIFEKSTSGVQTEFDDLVIHSTLLKAETTLSDLRKLPASEFSLKYGFQSKLKKIENAKTDISIQDANIEKIDYKIFNTQFCIYTGKTNGIMGRPRYEMMKNIIAKDNVSICLLRSLIDSTTFSSVFISKYLVDKNLYGFQTSVFPLYLYPETNSQQNLLETHERTPNLNLEIVNQIGEQLGLYFNPEEFDGTTTVETNQFTPLNILDYIYAVLHNPTYREKYKEFLKIDFPRVPYPKAPSPSERAGGEDFWQLVELGGELREIHLLESAVVEKHITQYPEDGDNIVGKPKFVTSSEVEKHLGRVYINETQYFNNVPEVGWNFYIGGYQPAQKWLKDRKGRELSYEDILHYQKMIVALSETDRIMKEIDKIEI